MPPGAGQDVRSAADLPAPAQTVDEVRGSLATTEKGQTANTISN